MVFFPIVTNLFYNRFFFVQSIKTEKVNDIRTIPNVPPVLLSVV